MDFVSLLRKRKHAVILSLLIIFYYLFSRLINLVDLPIFTDEAIYIRWAQIGGQDSSWRFISLTDGKQPLFVWGAMITLRLFSDPLFAGRLVSVISGIFSLIGIYFLGSELFKIKRIGIIASLLYLTSPYTLMYDRLALMDSLVAMFYIWSLYLSIRLLRTPRLDLAFILGFSLGGAVLTKTSGFINIYLMPFLFLLFDLTKHKRVARFIKVIGLLLFSVILSHIFYSILRLSPWFHMIAQKDTTFIYPISEWVEHPFRFFIGNIKALLEWMSGYLTIPIVTLIVISVIFIKIFWKEKFILLIWALAPMVGLALFGKVLYPRFILFTAMPLLVLASWSINYIILRFNYSARNIIILLLLVIIYPVFVQTKIVFSSLTAPIPKADLNQYINDEFSGWGIRETNVILESLARESKITVFTDGTFGLLPYGIEIYLVDNPNIRIIGLWPSPAEYSPEMISEMRERPTYFVANGLQEIPSEWNAQLLGKWQKGLRVDRFLRLYRLFELDSEIPKNEGISNI